MEHQVSTSLHLLDVPTQPKSHLNLELRHRCHLRYEEVVLHHSLRPQSKCSLRIEPSSGRRTLYSSRSQSLKNAHGSKPPSADCKLCCQKPASLVRTLLHISGSFSLHCRMLPPQERRTPFSSEETATWRAKRKIQLRQV